MNQLSDILITIYILVSVYLVATSIGDAIRKLFLKIFGYQHDSIAGYIIFGILCLLVVLIVIFILQVQVHEFFGVFNHTLVKFTPN